MKDVKNKMKEKLRKCKTIRYLKYKILKRYSKTFEEIKLVKDILEGNNVKFYYFETPKDYLIPDLTEFQKERIRNWVFDFNNIENDLDKLEAIYGKNFNRDYLISVYDGAKVVSVNNIRKLVDYNSEYVNIVNGIRYTTDVPEQYNNTIHIYGACTVRGTGVEDSHTIASFLQRKLNDEEKKYKVVNHGVGCGSTIEDDLYAIKTTILFPGDIVILLNSVCNSTEFYCKEHKLEYYRTSDMFIDNIKVKDNEWFTDETVHTNKIGNEVIADGIFNIIVKNFPDITFEKKLFTLQNLKTADINLEKDTQFNEYLKEISKYRIDEGTVGAIVMNCNPFTLGHRYLIETALKHVDSLIIFVVEEDKSFFPFEDRFKLIKEGISDLQNVIVIPSGSFIISALTFPGYFYKENDNSAIIDSSNDIDIFGKYIAPTLNIKKRFVGEEPIDRITKQYNETMKERLPLYGIECIEIKRKEDSENVISASRVRKYLKDKNFEKIKEIVPDTTYKYLKERFK